MMIRNYRTEMNLSFYFAGVTIDNLSLQESVIYIEKLLKGQKGHYIITPNAAHIVLFQRDEDFRKAYAKASLVLPDGMSLVWASRLILSINTRFSRQSKKPPCSVCPIWAVSYTHLTLPTKRIV
mgnify:CR=1 FL=1